MGNQEIAAFLAPLTKQEDLDDIFANIDEVEDDDEEVKSDSGPAKSKTNDLADAKDALNRSLQSEEAIKPDDSDIDS